MPEERRRAAGRRKEDIELNDIMTRMALSEQNDDYLKDEVTEVKQIIKSHIDDEGGDVRNLTKAIINFTEKTANQTAEIKNLTTSLQHISDVIQAIHTRQDDFEQRQKVIEKKVAAAEASGKTVLLLGTLIATVAGFVAWVIDHLGIFK